MKKVFDYKERNLIVSALLMIQNHLIYPEKKTFDEEVRWQRQLGYNNHPGWKENPIKYLNYLRKLIKKVNNLTPKKSRGLR
jgi:hypothetical protein